jgi:hypothetical protein
MRTRALLSALVVLLASGCVPSVLPGIEQPASYQAVQARAAHQPAMVLMRDGSLHQAETLQFSTFSTSWLDSAGRPVTVQTRTIDTITFAGRPRNQFNRVFAGILVGAASGAVVTSQVSPRTQVSPLTYAPEVRNRTTLIVAAALGVAGGVAGQRFVVPRDREVTFRVLLQERVRAGADATE